MVAKGEKFQTRKEFVESSVRCFGSRFGANTLIGVSK
jgi:hypothetical protein